MSIFKRSMNKLMVLSMALLLILTGCKESTPAVTETANPSATPTKADPPVNLTWYYITYEMQPDTSAVEKAVNDYIQPKINATVKLMPIIESGYKDKINTMLAAGEVFDLLWTSNWGGGDYEPKVRKGGFLDLTSLIDKTPKLKASMPQLAWDDTKVDGKIYAVPNYQIAAKAEGFAIQKRFIDKYNIDVTKIKKQADIEPVLKAIKEGEKDIVPILTTSNMFDFGRHYGYTSKNYKVGDSNYTVIDPPQMPEYKAFAEMVRKWYQAGYIYKDAATAKNDQLEALLKSGKVAVEWNVTMKPGGEVEDQKRFGGNEVVYVRISEPEFTGVQPTMTAISRTSKYPEKALQLLELVNTDPALFNLLTFGIDGKHYTKVGDNTIKINPNGGYKSDSGWVMGNVLNGYLKEGQAPDTWEKTKKLNESAKRPEFAAFKYNDEPVKTQQANIFTVEEEFAKAIQTGSVDIDTYLPKYIEARKKAGVDKVIAEHQKQLTEYFKANGTK